MQFVAAARGDIGGDPLESVRPRGVRSMAKKPPEKPDASVEAWRMQVLMDAGYPENDALSIAYSDADLHQACALIAQGCAVATAVEILL